MPLWSVLILCVLCAFGGFYVGWNERGLRL
jgi:hypothetical protein